VPTTQYRQAGSVEQACGPQACPAQQRSILWQAWPHHKHSASTILKSYAVALGLEGITHPDTAHQAISNAIAAQAHTKQPLPHQ